MVNPKLASKTETEAKTNKSDAYPKAFRTSDAHQGNCKHIKLWDPFTSTLYHKKHVSRHHGAHAWVPSNTSSNMSSNRWIGHVMPTITRRYKNTTGTHWKPHRIHHRITLSSLTWRRRRKIKINLNISLCTTNIADKVKHGKPQLLATPKRCGGSPAALWAVGRIDAWPVSNYNASGNTKDLTDFCATKESKPQSKTNWTTTNL